MTAPADDLELKGIAAVAQRVYERLDPLLLASMQTEASLHGASEAVVGHVVGVLVHALLARRFLCEIGAAPELLTAAHDIAVSMTDDLWARVLQETARAVPGPTEPV